MPTSKLKPDAMEIWQAAIQAVNARSLVAGTIACDGSNLRIGELDFELKSIGRVLVVGAGKACAAMARGIADELDGKIEFGGRVNVPDGAEINCGNIITVGVRPAGENLPTGRVIESTREVCRLIRDANENDLVLCLISGGGSALLEDPAIPLDDLRRLISHLSESGATIGQLNTVRKKLSRIKGGSLGRMFANECKSKHPLISLVVSDVLGDPLDLIASGPTAPDLSTSEQALEILDSHDPDGAFPASALALLGELVNCTSTRDLSWADRVRNIVIGNNQTAVDAAAAKANGLGYEIINASQESDFEQSHEAAGRLMQIANRSSFNRVCVLSGGEPVVRVEGSGGKGGRNHHLVLAALCGWLDGQIARPPGSFCLLSGGTDGEDGNVAFPGAIIDQNDLNEVAASGLTKLAVHSLESFDSHSFLSRIESVLPGIETQTNVCDLRILLFSDDAP